jgi:hypothetical protein
MLAGIAQGFVLHNVIDDAIFNSRVPFSCRNTGCSCGRFGSDDAYSVSMRSTDRILHFFGFLLPTVSSEKAVSCPRTV